MTTSGSQADAKQALIRWALAAAERPLNSKEISDRIKGKWGWSLSTAAIGANIAYMHRANEVAVIRCRVGMLRVGHQVYAKMLNYWYPADRKRAWAAAFKRAMYLANYQNYESTLPLEKRKRKRPISDDMRQMIEDIAQ